MSCFCTTKDFRTTALSAVGLRDKYWQPGYTIRIAFLNGTSEQQEYVKTVAAEWLKYCNLKFEYILDTNASHIRISFNKGDGSWSYIGTDSLFIGRAIPTMNFGWLDKAVVLHEFGHMLGLGHEHQNPNEPIEWDLNALYADLSQAPNNWSMSDIQHNIIDRYKFNQVDSTITDRHSIMMYQIPSRWTKNGFSAGFNFELSEMDKAFIAEKYPFKKLVHEDDVKLLRKVFQTKDELKKLKEVTLVRIGKHFDLDVNVKKRKAKNADIVSKFLNLEDEETN